MIALIIDYINIYYNHYLSLINIIIHLFTFRAILKRMIFIIIELLALK